MGRRAVDDQVAIIAIMAEDIDVLFIAIGRRISVRSDALARRVGIFQLGCGVAEAEAILLVGRQVELGATLFAGTLRHAGGGKQEQTKTRTIKLWVWACADAYSETSTSNSVDFCPAEEKSGLGPHKH